MDKKSDEFIDLVDQMRATQQEYFRLHTQSARRRAMRLERMVDVRLGRIKHERQTIASIQQSLWSEQ